MDRRRAKNENREVKIDVVKENVRNARRETGRAKDRALKSGLGTK